MNSKRYPRMKETDPHAALDKYLKVDRITAQEASQHPDTATYGTRTVSEISTPRQQKCLPNLSRMSERKQISDPLHPSLPRIPRPQTSIAIQNRRQGHKSSKTIHIEKAPTSTVHIFSRHQTTAQVTVPWIRTHSTR